jgi:hypothetical protein
MTFFTAGASHSGRPAFGLLQTREHHISCFHGTLNTRRVNASSGSANSGTGSQSVDDLNCPIEIEIIDCDGLESLQADASPISQQEMHDLSLKSVYQTPITNSVPSPPSVMSISNAEGWIIALSTILASYLGRMSAQEARLNPRRAQQSREESRALTIELRQKRDAWKWAEKERKAREEVARVSKAAQRAMEDARRREEQQQRYQREADEAAKQEMAKREAAKAAYEAQAAALKAEYDARLKAEQQRLEEERAKQRAQEELTRVEEEAKRKAREEERIAREAAEMEARQKAIREAIELRKRLERERQKFSLRIQGSVTISRPPKGTLLPSGQEASVRLSINAGSLLGGGQVNVVEDFGSIQDTRESSARVTSSACRAACEAAQSALRLQAMTGSGPLSIMETPEVDNWMALCVAKTSLAALKAFDEAHAGFVAVPKSGDGKACDFQKRTEIGVLPKGHEHSESSRLQRIISCIERGDGFEGDDACANMLTQVLDDADEDFSKDSDYGTPPSCLQKAITGSHRSMGSVFKLAHLLDRMLYDRPAQSSDAPAWFETGAALVRNRVFELLRPSPPDSLEPYSACVSAALGPLHPVAELVSKLAEENVSVAERGRRAEIERVRQATIAAKLLEEEWPDAAEIRAARYMEREAQTPIAERVWALKNVAGTLAMGGPGEKARARQLLLQAVHLKQQFAGAPDHPAVLPEVLALVQVLSTTTEWSRECNEWAGTALRALHHVATSYDDNGDSLSAAVVMESGLRELEEFAGVKSPAVKAATRRADQLMEGLSAADRQRLLDTRRDASSKDLISKVVKALTEELGAYTDSAQLSKVQLWDERGSAMIGPMLF